MQSIAKIFVASVVVLQLSCAAQVNSGTQLASLVEGQVGTGNFIGAGRLAGSFFNALNPECSADTYYVAALADGSFFWFYDTALICTASGRMVQKWKAGDNITVENGSWKNAACATPFKLTNTRNGEIAYGGVVPNN